MQYRPEGLGSEGDADAAHGRRSVLVGAIVAVWLGLAAAGMAELWRYKSTPGALAPPPSRFPAESALPREHGAASLLVFVHPHCTCTRATLYELATVLAASARVPTTSVVVADGPSLGDVERSEAFRLAASIPTVRVIRDAGGREASLFHALTSGEAVVYDAEGRLAFHGGITGSRGHAGDNRGRRQLVAALERGSMRATESPVFGCAIDDEEVEP